MPIKTAFVTFLYKLPGFISQHTFPIFRLLYRSNISHATVWLAIPTRPFPHPFGGNYRPIATILALSRGHFSLPEKQTVLIKPATFGICDSEFVRCGCAYLNPWGEGAVGPTVPRVAAPPPHRCRRHRRWYRSPRVGSGGGGGVAAAGWQPVVVAGGISLPADSGGGGSVPRSVPERHDAAAARGAVRRATGRGRTNRQTDGQTDGGPVACVGRLVPSRAAGSDGVLVVVTDGGQFT